MSVLVITESGKWKHLVSLNDPVFKPILGALVEEGMNVPNPFILRGSVAEVIEKEWEEVKRVDECVKEVKKTLQTMSWAMRTTSLVSLLYDRFRHITNVLDLPLDWHIATVMTDEAPLNERVDHYSHLNLTVPSILGRKNWDIFCVQDTLAYKFIHADIQSFQCKANWKRVFPITDTTPSPLAPFLHNLWLQDTKLTMSTLLQGVDWAAMPSYLEKINYSSYWPRITLSGHSIHGGTHRITQLSTLLSGGGFPIPSKYDYVIGYSDDHFLLPSTLDKSTAEWLYTRMLSSVTASTSIKLMGLEYILGGMFSYSLKHSVMNWMGPKDFGNRIEYYHGYVRGVGISKFLGWINAHVITYLERIALVRTSGTKSMKTWMTMHIDTDKFENIVRFIGKTLGIAALRAMIVVLKPITGRVEQPYHRGEGKYKRSVRAEAFIELADRYIIDNIHQGEGIVSLNFETVAASV
jgi:hypothetical protein